MNNFKYINNKEDIEKILKQLHLSCFKFSKMVGLTRQTIYNIINGKYKLTKSNIILFNYAIDDYIKNNNLVLKKITIYEYYKK